MPIYIVLCTGTSDKITTTNSNSYHSDSNSYHSDSDSESVRALVNSSWLLFLQHFSCSYFLLTLLCNIVIYIAQCNTAKENTFSMYIGSRK